MSLIEHIFSFFIIIFKKLVNLLPFSRMFRMTNLNQRLLHPFYSRVIEPMVEYLLDDQPIRGNQNDFGFFIREIINLPKELNHFFIQEITVSILTSFGVLSWVSVILYFNFFHLFSCDKVLLTWLTVVFSLSFFGIFTKLVIWRLFKKSQRIRRTNLLRQKLTSIIRMRIFRINSRISNAACFVYLSSIIRMLLMDCRKCGKEFFETEITLMALFCIRMLFSFVRFLRIFNWTTEISQANERSYRGINSFESRAFEKIEKYMKKTGHKGISEECIICIDKFHANSVVVATPCPHSHVFHKKCLKKWLNQQAYCPICKFNFQNYFQEKNE